jgi:bifunctional DNA-binding transcriptional regulator/antitoxin component of YhaV-PrlF toxin-antitoxin module
MLERRVISITSKGQATIPTDLRRKFGFGKRALVEETEGGVLFKPLPSVEDERGSLRELFDGRSARDLLEEAREEDGREILEG